MNLPRSLTLLAAAACSLAAQPASSYRYTVKGDEKTVEITNVHYEIAGRGNVSLVVRETTHSKQVLGDIGMEASTTTEAWKLGSDIKGQPLYSVTVEGSDSHVVEDDLFVVSRGLEEVEWWSVYRLATGAHMFDTYVPLVKVGESTGELRYAGLEVAADDTKDARLKEAHVVAVLTYSSAAKVIREALLTCDDPQQAKLLRSFADETRTLTARGDKSVSLRLSFSPSFPPNGATISITIPIAADNLDLAHAQLPPHVHIAAWKR
jgi:hypothetical protein